MKDLDDMTPDEIRAWAEAQAAASRAQFADRPTPRPSRSKMDTDARWFEGEWQMPVFDGAHGTLTTNSRGEEPVRLRGLGRSAHDGTVVLLVVWDGRLVEVRHLAPSRSWGDDVDATTYPMGSAGGASVALHVTVRTAAPGHTEDGIEAGLFVPRDQEPE